MPVVPLKKLSYEDAGDLRRVIDVLNQNFQLLDWLLNHQNLDPVNISPTIIEMFPPQSGGAIVPATLVVAANDSRDKTRADLVVPDGSTSAQEIINQAISALPPGGGQVVLLEGTYIVDGSIIAPDKVTIDGQGAGTVIKVKDSLGVSIFQMIINSDSINGNSEIVIANLKLDGNQAGNPGFNMFYGIYLQKVQKCAIRNVFWESFSSYDIALIDSNNNFVIGNTCSSIGLGKSTTGCLNNLITGNTVVGDGINLEYSSGNIVAKNVCLNGAASYSDGIVLSYSSDYNLITKNVCENNSVGILLTNGPVGNIVSKNICRNNAYHGIHLYGSYNGSKITKGNIVSKNMAFNNGQHGIYLQYYAKDNEISGNYCVGNGQSSHDTYSNIKISQGSNYNNVQGNTCRQGDLANKPKCGISISGGTCQANLVANNDCYNGGYTLGIEDIGTNTNFGAGNRNKDGTWSTVPN